jgi:hypothetical protein
VRARNCQDLLTDPSPAETNSGNSDNKQRSSVFRVSVKSIQTLETTTMKTSLGSLLASTMQAIGAGFRAFFTFSERDARILASAYGFPPPEIEDLQDSRPYEKRAENRGRSDCQKVSTDRDALGELPATNRVERQGHRRNGYLLTRPGFDRRLIENGRVRRKAQQAVFARPFRSGGRGSSLKRFF